MSTKSNDNPTSIGEVYGFFDCDIPKEEIQAELPTIHSEVQSPSGLELSLMEVKELERRESNPDLLRFIHENATHPIFPSAYKHLISQAKPIAIADLRYVIHATNPQATLEETASALTSIMDQVCLKFGEGKPFTVAILGKIDGQYQFYVQ